MEEFMRRKHISKEFSDERFIGEEIKRLELLIEQLRTAISSAPKGRLRSEMCKGKYPQFYFIEDGFQDGKQKNSQDSKQKNSQDSKRENLQDARQDDRQDARQDDRQIDERDGKQNNGRYIKKEEYYLAEELAQKEYNLKLLKCVAKQCELLKSAENIRLDKLRNERLEILHHISLAKQGLIRTYEMTDEEYVENWMQENSGGKNSIEITNGFDTERGDVVRSKSEKIIADKLFYCNIIYQYEPLIRLHDGTIVFPDFAMLNIRTRKTIYLEHFGMMDNPEYCKRAIEKMEIYERNELFTCRDVVYTFESSNKAININSIENIINRFLN